jgi:HKD family nuclease
MQLFSRGNAEVIGAPKSFDLLKELTAATSIHLAVAFAHQSGWRMLKPSLAPSKTKLRLLAGGSFFHTEPTVLRSWMKLAGTEAKLYLAKGLTFHPKVLIVEGPRPFAIVGSGNLSRGGLETNVECGVYLTAPAQLSELHAWFDDVFADAQSVATVIDDYERKWKALREKAEELTKKQKELEDDLIEKADAAMENWNDAVSSAKKFRGETEFKSHYNVRVEAGKRIQEYLHFPGFDFNHTEWKQFYEILELGRLIAIPRDRIFKKRTRLQNGLKQLISSDGSERILEALLSEDGEFHINGLGLNTISKVLAVHAPDRFSVYNTPVDKTLRSFGYVPPRGATKAGKYLAYNRMMGKFKKVTGLHDAYALDVFFYHYAKGLNKIAAD